MLSNTHYTVSVDLLQEAISQLPIFDQRLDLTVPTGNFFYDTWKISDTFKNTVWEELLLTLPINFGQARLMRLKPGEAYYSHADMDDRYHLNLIGEKSFLVNLDDRRMFSTVPDRKWYLMDAGFRHSAVNFSNKDRIQLVVRKLLTHGIIKNPIKVNISCDSDSHDFRYLFDDIFSPWLNRKNKLGAINDFKLVDEHQVSFVTEQSLASELKEMCPEKFKINL